MSQQVRILDAKLDNLRMVAGTHMTEGWNYTYSCSDLHTHTMAHAHK